MKERIKEELTKRGFVVIDYSDIKTSVDLIAKKDDTVLILRIIGNLDAIRNEHALDMLNLADILKGKAIIIAERSRWGPLKPGTVYFRYGVPAMSPETFIDYIEGNAPQSLYIKGKEIVRIDRDLLRRRRMELGLSLHKLAELVGTTKETIYRYERGYYPTRDVAEELERILGVKLIKEVEPTSEPTQQELNYPFSLLHNLGGNVREFKRLPWNALAKKRTTISFLLPRERKHLRRRVRILERAKGEVFSYYLVIGKHRGVPFIEEEEIEEAESFEEIEKIARERNEER